MNPENPIDISTPEGDDLAYKHLDQHGYVWVISNNHVRYLTKDWIFNLLKAVDEVLEED